MTATTTAANGTNAVPSTVETPPTPATALAPRPVAPPPAPDHGGTIDVFASAANFGVAQRMAMGLASSTMVPEVYRSKTFGPKGEPTDTMALGNCMIAIELASRIGASVFAVMQNLDIIHGRPGWRSTFLIATVNACGRFTPLRFRFEGKPGSDDWGCRAVAKERDSGEELVGALITMALAKAEGWATKQGSKWKTMPEQMLCYRAAAFWTRIYAPELSIGMSTSDEVSDITGAQGPGLTSMTTTGSKLLEQQLLAQPVSAPSAPAAPDSEPSTSSAGKNSAIVPAPAAEEPTNAAPAEEPKAAPKKRGAGAAPTLPVGDLLPAAAKKDVELDPYGEPVPPVREPGED